MSSAIIRNYKKLHYLIKKNMHSIFFFSDYSSGRNHRQEKIQKGVNLATTLHAAIFTPSARYSVKRIIYLLISLLYFIYIIFLKFFELSSVIHIVHVWCLT